MTKASLRHTMNHKDLLDLFRSSHRRCSVRKGILKNFARFTRKRQCWSLQKTTSISPQNTITNIGGKFGLDETSTECNLIIFLNVSILFNQIQTYNLYAS